MLKNLFAKFGYGSANVDLVLHGNSFTVGDTINGQLVIQGGNVKQKINKIDVDFQLSIFQDGNEYKQSIQTFPFHQSFDIHPGEQRSFPFSYNLPTNLPISAATVQYYFITRLDIAGGVDSSDRDYITIEPPLPLQKVLAALNQLGFQEKHDSREFEGYAQEFEFAPVSGPFFQQVEELEFYAGFDLHGVHLLLEVEIPSFVGEHEVKREIFIPNETIEDPSALVNFLQQTIAEMVNQPHAFGPGPLNYFSGVSPSSSSSSSSSSTMSALGGAAIGAIGGFAAGVLATQAVSSLMNDDDDDDEEDNTGNFFAQDDESDGGFFDDNEDEEVDFDGFFGDDED